MQNEPQNTDAGKENFEQDKQQTQQPKAEESKPAFDGQAFYSEGYKNAFNLVDNTLTSLGYEKPEGAKTTEWVQSLIKQASEASKEKEAPTPEENDLSEYRAKFEAFENENKALKEKLSLMHLQAYETKLNKAIPDNFILPVGLDAEGKQAYTEAIKGQIANELKEVFQEKDGKIIAVNSEGVPLINPKTAKPYTPKEYVQVKFKTFYSAAKEKKAEVNIKEIKTAGINLQMDVIPTNQRQVTELLIKNGLAAGSPEHLKAFVEIVKQYKINTF